MDSGDLDICRPDTALAMLEEALISSGDHISLLFFRRLDRLGVRTSSSSIKVTRDLKKLLLASNLDIFLCIACCHEIHQVIQLEKFK